MLRRIVSMSFVIILTLALSVNATVTAQAPTAPQALLQFSAGGHILGFAAGGMYAATGSHALHVGFVGANRVQPQADSPTSADGSAAPLSRVTYAGLWDGVTLTYTSAAGGIYTTTYSLAPGANPDKIRLHYNAPLTLNADGTLSIAFKTGTMNESAPVAWQEINGSRVSVEAVFRLRGQEVAFTLGAYDPRHPLTIDPSLLWNTFLGGSKEDIGNGIAVDGSGNIYVAGMSDASWGSPLRAYASGDDAFAAQLNSSGSLLWNTFLGGSGDDWGCGIAVDGNGNVYLAGTSYATWGSPKRAYTSSLDTFAAKLNPSGSLLWNTFLGGSGWDDAYSIAVGGSGNVYVTGTSDVTWGSPLRAYTRYGDAFAAQLNSSGSLLWNTFLGGSGDDWGFGIAVDASGNVYVTGYSNASWGSPVRAYTGNQDAFAAKLNSSGSLLWNTFLGGSWYDKGWSIAADGNGNVYVAGTSDATWGSPKRAYGGGLEDAFAAKLDSSGSLLWNTFLGGSGWDDANSIAVDGNGNVYLAGTSYASWGSPVRSYTNSIDAFAVKLNSSGNLLWNTFLGGSGIEYGGGIAVDGSGNVYVAGTSDATWGSPLRAHTSGDDAFIAKVDLTPLIQTFRSMGGYDGWVLESSETSGKGGTMNSTATVFYVGDNAKKKQYRGLLSFNTASLPDTAVITKVTLKLKLQGTAGTSPFTTHGNLLVDIRKGPFGGNTALQLGDFQATASGSNVASMPKTPVSGWYTKNFSSAAFTYINKTGVTQFRLRFTKDDDNDAVADYLKFYSGNAGAANQPQLIVEYYVP